MFVPTVLSLTYSGPRPEVRDLGHNRGSDGVAANLPLARRRRFGILVPAPQIGVRRAQLQSRRDPAALRSRNLFMYVPTEAVSLAHATLAYDGVGGVNWPADPDLCVGRASCWCCVRALRLGNRHGGALTPAGAAVSRAASASYAVAAACG